MSFNISNLSIFRPSTNILAEGYIYPKEEHAIRELLRKNGNKYLAWTYVEAAHFSLIHGELARRYYQKKISKTKTEVAIKALASKLARASYFVMRDQVDFEATRLFGK